jgi:YfiR/HmsC-like
MDLLTTRRRVTACHAGLRNRRGVCFCLLLALWITFSGGVFARAESPSPTMHQVQAAFLFNFAKFVTWPDDAFQRSKDSLIIGVLGEDPFGAVLDEIIRDKTVTGKKLAVKRFMRVQDAVNSHILFLSSSEESHLPQILKGLERTTVLTVSDMEQFAERGGMVAFTVEDQKVRFNVNADAVERAGLKMGSQLLKLAKIVSDKPRAGN